MRNNKTLGNWYEELTCRMFMDAGYWCHLFAYKANGQPCDIIAIKGNKVFLVDVKHCETNKFYKSRVEPNQETCFKYAMQCGIKNCGFVIWYNGNAYWLPYNELTDVTNVEGLKSFYDEVCN